MNIVRSTAGLATGIVALLASSLAAIPAANAAPSPTTAPVAAHTQAKPSGKKQALVKVKVSTPKGMPATVRLVRRSKAVVVAVPGPSKTVTRKVRVQRGRHKVLAPDVTYRGRLYLPRVSRRTIVAKPGRPATVKVRYRKSAGAHSLALSNLTTTSIALSWSAKKSTGVILRRTPGSAPAANRRAGTAVRTTGRSATDGGLAAGTEYTYSLFSKVRGRWTAPVTVTAGTTPAPGTNKAAYVLTEGATLLAPSQISDAHTTATGVSFKLVGLTPLLGRAVVVPVTAALPGGYLGHITAIAPDGTVSVSPAAIGDAFDYYSLPQQTIDTGDLALTPKPGDTVGTPRPSSAARAAKLSIPSCLTGTMAGRVTFAPTIDIDGTFQGDVVTKQVKWFPDLPQGARLAGSLQATVGGALSASMSGGVKCGVDFQPLVVPVAVTPVPIQLRLEPQVEVTATGEVKVSNVGARATSGAWFKTQFGLGIDNYADGGPIKEAYPLTPAASGTGALGLRVGGEMILGPGAGTSAAGAIAGVRGTLDVLNASASFTEVVKSKGPPEVCGRLGLSYGLNFDVVGKAWIPGWETERAIDIPGLHATGEYGGPWYHPTDCEKPGSNDVYVLLVDEEDNSSSNVGTALESFGYSVTYGTTMPTKPADYGQIWVFGVYSGYDTGLIEALGAYTRTGGAVMINSEHVCCPDINDGVDRFLDSILTVDVTVVTDCVDLCRVGADALNPAARGAIASTPNAGATVTTSALGYYTGVPGPNQLVVSGDQVGGTVWEPADMIVGKGRVVTLGDSNWSNDGNVDSNLAFIENVAAFLSP